MHRLKQEKSADPDLRAAVGALRSGATLFTFRDIEMVFASCTKNVILALYAL